MKMHNDPHSWPGLLELFQSWWRGDTPLGAVLMSLVMAGLRVAYFGGGVGLIGVDAIRGFAMRFIGGRVGADNNKV